MRRNMRMRIQNFYFHFYQIMLHDLIHYRQSNFHKCEGNFHNVQIKELGSHQFINYKTNKENFSTI